jgi:hypothetical protein
VRCRLPAAGALVASAGALLPEGATTLLVEVATVAIGPPLPLHVVAAPVATSVAPAALLAGAAGGATLTVTLREAVAETGALACSLLAAGAPAAVEAPLLSAAGAAVTCALPEDAAPGTYDVGLTWAGAPLPAAGQRADSLSVVVAAAPVVASASPATVVAGPGARVACLANPSPAGAAWAAWVAINSQARTANLTRPDPPSVLFVRLDRPLSKEDAEGCIAGKLMALRAIVAPGGLSLEHASSESSPVGYGID